MDINHKAKLVKSDINYNGVFFRNREIGMLKSHCFGFLKINPKTRK